MQQQRGRYQQGYSVAGEPVLFLVFDLLRLGDTNLVDEPYDRRRERLEPLPLPHPERIAVAPAFTHAAHAADGMTPLNLLVSFPPDRGGLLYAARLAALVS